MTGDHVPPAAVDGIEQRGVAELRGHIDGATVEVQLSDGVTGDRVGLPYRRMVLPVGPSETSVAEEPPASAVDHARGKVEIPSLARRPEELDECHLDLGVPVDPRSARRTELSLGRIRSPDRDIDEVVEEICRALK